MLRGELDLAQRSAEDLLRLSRQRNDPGGLVLGHFSSGRNLMLCGKFTASRSHLERALALYDLTAHGALAHSIELGSGWATGTRPLKIYPGVNSLSFLGIVLFCLGFPDQALAQSTAAIVEARRLTDPPSLAWTLALGSALASLVGDNVTLGKLAGQRVAVATEHGLPNFRAQATIYRGWVKAKSGDLAEGISALRSGLTAYRATGAEAGIPHFNALLAEACELAGQIENGLTLLDDALEVTERTGERWLAPELNRRKGQLMLRQGNARAAEEMYRKALSIAEEQEAKLWELRASVSLARLRRNQGRDAEARDLLAPIFGWFTEGFGTGDLKAARAVLDALA